MDRSLFLIWSIEHSAWWKPNCCGYTESINAAGVYSREEAQQICDRANQHGGEPQEVYLEITEKNVGMIGLV